MRRQCMRPRLRLLGEFVGCFQDKVRYGPSLPWKRSCNLSQEDQYAPPPVGELFWPGCFCTSDCKLQHLCQSIFFIFFYIRIDPAESSTLEWLSSKLTESVSLMYVTGLLLYAAIISALVGYLGSGLAKSVISSTKVRISRKIYKTKLFCRGSSQSWWDVHLLPPESCLDIQGETGRLTKHQNQ